MNTKTENRYNVMLISDSLPNSENAVFYRIFYCDIFAIKGFYERKVTREELYREEIPVDIIQSCDTPSDLANNWKTLCPTDVYEKCMNEVVI